MDEEYVSVHVNSRYVDSNKPDLDVYDTYTLQRAVQSCARHINVLSEMGKPEEAQPYVDFKNRIKQHLRENSYA